MLINEAGLVRAIKRAYKGGGYTVNVQDGIMSIYTESWYIQARQKMVPRKALAAIVEHAGLIPGENEPINIKKDLDPQLVIPETAAEEMSAWRVGERGDNVDLVPVIMQGFQIFQAEEGACWGVPLYHLGMIERDAAEHQGAIVVANDRLLWDDDGEAVVVEAVRKGGRYELQRLSSYQMGGPLKNRGRPADWSKAKGDRRYAGSVQENRLQ